MASAQRTRNALPLIPGMQDRSARIIHDGKAAKGKYDGTQNLALAAAEKERISAELDIARSIQTSMLPCTFPAFPDRPELDIYAAMTPAREVGGDFYDFFLVGADIVSPRLNGIYDVLTLQNDLFFSRGEVIIQHRIGGKIGIIDPVPFRAQHP